MPDQSQQAASARPRAVRPFVVYFRPHFQRDLFPRAIGYFRSGREAEANLRAKMRRCAGDYHAVWAPAAPFTDVVQVLSDQMRGDHDPVFLAAKAAREAMRLCALPRRPAAPVTRDDA